MILLWFYISIVLAISDEIHSKIMWNLLNDFYILFGGMINKIVSSNLQGWLIHEGLEAVFHFIILSIVFISIEIGILAALTHLVIDLVHSLAIKEMNTIEHRALHFVFESLFFICVFSL
jgi:hypothetical protein